MGFAAASANAPYPLWDSIVNVENSARSNYRSVTIALNKRMSKGLQFAISYSHTKNLANADGWNPTSFVGEGDGQSTDYYHPNLDYGRVPFGRNQRFLATFLYEIYSHSGNRAVWQLLGGWEVAGVLMFQTGPYLSVTAPGTDPSGTNSDNSFAGGDPRAEIVTGAHLYPKNRSINQWVNPAAFRLPPDNIGTLRRLAGRRRRRPGNAGDRALDLQELPLQGTGCAADRGLLDEPLQPSELPLYLTSVLGPRRRSAPSAVCRRQRLGPAGHSARRPHHF